MKKFQNKSKVFRHSSDIVADAPQGLPCKHITSYSTAFQVISVISPPGLPAEMADRRIWRMKAIVRQLAFVYYPKDFRFLRYSAISSSLTVSQTCCSSLTTKSRSFGR